LEQRLLFLVLARVAALRMLNYLDPTEDGTGGRDRSPRNIWQEIVEVWHGYGCEKMLSAPGLSPARLHQQDLASGRLCQPQDCLASLQLFDNVLHLRRQFMTITHTILQLV